MKPGEQFDCPHCGKNTFVLKESVMDGWTKKGEVLKCVSCGAVIEEIKAPEQGNEAAANPADGKKNALAALLGVDDDPGTPKAETLFTDEKRFCRDCVYRVMTAFRIRCAKHEKDVNPMDDCDDFVRRKTE